MKALIASVLLVATAIGLSSAIGANSPDRPPGVAAADWVPISDSLGLVLIHSNGRSVIVAPGALLPTPPAEGYFMVRRRSGWKRLAVIEPFREQRTAD